MNLKSYLKCLLVLAFFGAFSTKLLAQSGEIIGLVKDELGVLPFSNVLIKGTTNGTTSDLEGNFRLVNVDAGDHILQFTYLGYELKEVNVNLTTGQSLNIGEVMMKATTASLDEVIIKSNYLPSQQKALNIKKQSMAIMEVLASDAIGKLPDRNAAEAVQRMQGVSIERDHGEGRYVIVRGTPISWNSTLMNGDRMPSTEGTSNGAGGRTAPLDVFPSEMIEFVQLSKAITPDMEGDAIGGSVNFITRTAPNKKTLTVNLGYGNNFQAQKPIQNASIVYGDKEADGKIGFMLSGTYWNRNWGTDNFEVAYNDNKSINTMELRDYLGERRTVGFNAGFEYKPNDNNKIYLRGLYTDFTDNETAAEHTFSFEDSEMTLRLREGVTAISLFGTEIGGDHDFSNGTFNLKWKASTYDAEMGNRNIPGSTNDRYNLVYFSTPVTYGNLTNDGEKFLDIDSPSGYNGDPFDNLQPYLSASVNPDDLVLSQILSLESYSKETDYSGQLDLTAQPSDKVKIKFGGKYKAINLKRGAPMDIYLDFSGSRSMTDFPTTGFPSRGGFLTEMDSQYDNVLVNTIYNKDHIPELLADEALMGSLFQINRDENNPDTAGSYYRGKENVAAAYAMADVNLTDKFKVIGGVRYEHTYLRYNGNSVTTNMEGDQEINPIENKNDYGSLLPMLHFKYTPKDNFNLKLAYTRTFARPNFNDLNPTESVSIISRPFTVTRGNIELEPTYSNNFDFMGEYFFKNVGLLSGGVFYKDLENVIYEARSLETIDGDLYQVTQPNNSESGWLAGFEMGISKRLTFLPGFLSGFGIEANYTFTDSEMNVPEYTTDENTGEVSVSTTTEKIPNQSQHIFNSSLFYENHGLMLRIAGNYKGESLAEVQGSDPDDYRWYDKNFTVDFSGSYTINRNLKVFVELNNLTNEPLRYYQGVSERPEQTEYYSLRGMLGISYRIF